MRADDGGLEVLVTVSGLLLAYVLGHFINTARLKHVPQSTASIAVGILAGFILSTLRRENSNLPILDFNPESFYFLLLPPILLEAGFSLDRPNFGKNFLPILYFAIIGTLISAAIVSEGLILLSSAFPETAAAIINSQSLEGESAPSQDSIRAYCWLFGALLSAVDPVAILSILGGSRFEPNERLFALVFGESILNDAVAIVLYRIIQDLHFRTQKNHLSLLKPVQIFIAFVQVTFTSMLVGASVAGVAYFCFRVSKGLKKFPEYELGLLLLLSYFSFCVAEVLEGSGILAIFITGIILGHYNLRNLSPSSQRSATLLFKVVSVLSESFIYMLLGVVSVASFSDWTSSAVLGVVAISCVLILVSRALSVFPACGFFNWYYPKTHIRDFEDCKQNEVCALNVLLTCVTPTVTQSLKKSDMRLTDSRIADSKLVEQTRASEPARIVDSGRIAEPGRQSDHFRASDPSKDPRVLDPSRVSERTSDGRGNELRHSNSGEHGADGRTGLSGRFSRAGSDLQIPAVIEEESFFSRQTSIKGRLQERLQFIMSGAAGHREASPPSIRHVQSPDEMSPSISLPQVEEVYLSLPSQIILFMSGLRGAIAFALALSLPPSPLRRLFVSSTLAIVLLTTIVLGGSIELTALKLGILQRSHTPTNSEAPSSFSRASFLLGFPPSALPPSSLTPLADPLLHDSSSRFPDNEILRDAQFTGSPTAALYHVTRHLGGIVKSKRPHVLGPSVNY